MKPGKNKGNRARSIIVMLAVIIVTGGSLWVFQGCEGFGDNFDTIDGVWQVNEDSKDFGYQSYEVMISYSANDSSKIEIKNFYNLGTGIKVIANIIFWDVSIQHSAGGFSFNGSGVISGDMRQIDLTYTANDGSGSPDNVTATFTR